MTELRLLTFVQPELRRARGEAGWDVVPIQGKPLALLVRLASFGHGQPVSRDALAGELWSELDPDRARAQFRTALWSLRKALPDAAISADDATVTLVEPIPTDRADFQAAVRARNYAAAVEIYRGEFLAHFAVSGARGFEEWADLERRNLKGLFVAAAEAESHNLTVQGRFAQAVALAERARAAEPLNLGAWRALLQALLAAGDAVRAKAEADDLIALQSAEGLELDSETKRLLRQARTATPYDNGHTRHDLPEPELTGRERDLAGLVALYDGVERKRAAFAAVLGPPGIGKSRLLRDFARLVETRRGRVIATAAPRSNNREPYSAIAVIAELLGQLPGALGVSPGSAAVLVELHPALSGVFHDAHPPASPPDHRVRLLAIAELVRAVAEENRLAIVVDDAQWLDASSRAILDALPAACATCPLLVVFGERSDRELPGGDAQRFMLAPLTPALTEAMVTSCGHLPDEPWVGEWMRALHHTSSGVPLAVLDIIRLCMERGVLSLDGRCWTSVQPAALLRLTEAAAPRRRRLELLPEASRRVALLLGVAGTAIDAATAAATLGMPRTAVNAAVDVLATRGIARLERDVLSLEHHEYGAAAREIASQAEGDALRVALARVLATRTDAEALRRAFALADEAHDEQLIESIARRYVAVIRGSHPGRSTRDAIADLMGLGHRGEHLDRLEGRIEGPRRRLRRAAFAGAAVVVFAIATTGAVRALRLAARPPDVELGVIVRGTTGDARLVRVPLRFEGWTPGVPIQVDVRRGTPFPHADLRSLSASPTVAGRWVAVRENEPPRLDDLVLIEPDGSVRDLAPADGDDVAPVWSPDGESVAFITARWAAREWADIAVVHVASGAVTRIGGGPGRIASVNYNWDGTGLVFIRQPWEGPRNVGTVCTLVIETRAQRCLAPDATRNPDFASWASPAIVRFASPSSGRPGMRISVWNTDVDMVTDIGACEGTPPGIPPIPLSSAMICVRQNGTERTVKVAPVERIGEWRPLQIVSSAPVGIMWTGVTAQRALPPPYAQLRIHGGAFAVEGVPHMLTGVAIRADSIGTPVAPRWEVVAGRAAITHDGMLLPGGPGLVEVRATLGALADTARVVVSPSDDTPVLAERWSPDWLQRWRRFGIPYPQVIRDSVGAAFWTAGDASYYSGAYSTVVVDARRGVAVDWELQTPVTGRAWQRTTVAIVAAGDGARRLAWDHRTGWPRIGGGSADCSFEYPVGTENETFGTQMATLANAHPAPRRLAAGARYVVRLQLFPDGRCGAALDGVPIDVLWRPAPIDSVRFTLYGASVGTRHLVRRVRVVTGVPGDVAWPVAPPGTSEK